MPSNNDKQYQTKADNTRVAKRKTTSRKMDAEEAIKGNKLPFSTRSIETEVTDSRGSVTFNTPETSEITVGRKKNKKP